MKLVKPNWPAPLQVNAFSTTRDGGVSKPPFDSLNLGFHVGDNAKHVEQNRHILNQSLPAPALWLNQTHTAPQRCRYSHAHGVPCLASHPLHP